MTHFFHGEITQDSVINLVIAIDSDEAQDVDLYFSSSGGDLNMAEVLIDYFSNSIKNITLIGHWSIESAALEVFIRSICKKRLLPDAFGMVHLADRSLSLKSLTKKDPDEMFLVKDVEIYNRRWLQDRKGFFTRQEMSNIKKGIDVYLEHDRLEDYIKRFGYELLEDEEPHPPLS